MNQTEKRILFTAEDIARQVERLASQICADYQGKEIVLVGVLKGAFIFLADLVRRLTISVELDFIRVASYGAGTESTGEIRITTDVELDLQGRDVLIVEDIVDSGLTTAFLREHLAGKNPRSLRICTLLDKTERRRVTIPLDYVGVQLDKGFVVGYGLDCDEAHRHLPEIYELIL
ncbi:MAG: hypoxanthine phosphoribosyltransferase [Deltaproteobacteria bacterium]|nr:MAG: hypoxanthine phosphoribosyltransferase [Deltaproteobacteria bacterium]